MRNGSQRSTRKVSAHSLASDRSDAHEGAQGGGGVSGSGGDESPGVFSDEHSDSAFDAFDEDETDYGAVMPWIKVRINAIHMPIYMYFVHFTLLYFICLSDFPRI